MIIFLFTQQTNTCFAKLSIRDEFVNDDPQAFLIKKAQSYAKIRRENVRAEAEGLISATGQAT